MHMASTAPVLATVGKCPEAAETGALLVLAATIILSPSRCFDAALVRQTMPTRCTWCVRRTLLAKSASFGLAAAFGRFPCPEAAHVGPVATAPARPQ